MPYVNITNRDLESISWTNASACDFMAGNQVDVWRINVSSSLSLIESFLPILSPAEIARANRYFHAKDKNRFIISRGALRHILGKYLGQPASSVSFGESENKKPFIINKHKINLHYNLSHSGDWILAAIANSEIGADVEHVNNDFHYQEVAAESLSTDEMEDLNRQTAAARFFLMWTRKEALLKATGKGLDDHLKLIPALNGTHSVPSLIISSDCDWFTSSFYLNEEYAASVTNSGLVEGIRFWDADTLAIKSLFLK